jgi:hypothetical protein
MTYYPIHEMSQGIIETSSVPYNILYDCRVVSAIGKTVEVQKAIDEIFSEVQKETIDFKL